MIKVNIDELERLLDVFIRLESDADNIMGKTTMLRNEMLNDPEFTGNPKSEQIISILDHDINCLIELNEDIRICDGLFNKAKDDFEANENELINAIGEISNRLDSIIVQLDATINSNQTVVVDNSEEMRPVSEVEKLVAGSSISLESTNVSALSKLAASEAKVNRIEDK